MTPGWTRTWTKDASRSFRGGQGTSFLGRGPEGETVFIKELQRQTNLQARKRFAREVGCYETLQHAGLPRLLDHNATDWRDRTIPLYLVLELIEGPTIGEYVRQRGPLPPDLAVELLTALVDIIEYCHSNDVVHRDLKPATLCCGNKRSWTQL